MKRTAAVVASLAVSIAGLASVPTATAAPARSPAQHVAGLHPAAAGVGRVRRRDPEGRGSECADLVVPLDYARPRGRKITLAVSRLVHTSSDADYQGRDAASTPAAPAAPV